MTFRRRESRPAAKQSRGWGSGSASSSLSWCQSSVSLWAPGFPASVSCTATTKSGCLPMNSRWLVGFVGSPSSQLSLTSTLAYPPKNQPKSFSSQNTRSSGFYYGASFDPVFVSCVPVPMPQYMFPPIQYRKEKKETTKIKPLRIDHPYHVLSIAILTAKPIRTYHTPRVPE